MESCNIKHHMLFYYWGFSNLFTITTQMRKLCEPSACFVKLGFYTIVWFKYQVTLKLNIQNFYKHLQMGSGHFLGKNYVMIVCQ